MKIELPQTLEGYVDAEVKSGRFVDPGAVVAAAMERVRRAQTGLAYGDLGALADGDVMAVAFIVMMEAAKSAREDLKSIMKGVRAINVAKRSLRKLATRVARDVAGNACRGAKARGLVFSSGLGSERAYHKADLPHLDPDAPGGVSLATVDLWPAGKLTKRCELDEILDDIRNRLENLSEMGEMESLRLQMAMDRLSKMMSTLSNLLKKASDTAQAITQNLK